MKKYLKRTFNNEDFEKEKKLIKQKYEEKRERLLDNLNKEKLLPIIKKIGNEEEEIIYSEKTRINFSITDQETQIAITPSPH